MKTSLGCFMIMSWLYVAPTSAQTFDACSDKCCANKGGVHYCDSSAGRFVCGDGDYSSCYCTRHAVMDLQKIHGCCLWQGGVFKIDPKSQLVICNDGGVSEICSVYHAEHIN